MQGESPLDAYNCHFMSPCNKTPCCRSGYVS